MTTVISVNQAEQPEHPEDSMLRPEPAVVTRTNSNRSTANETKDSIVKGKKLGHRRVKDGEVTYKKFETTQLMGSIQLGIQQSVGNLGCQEDRDLLHEDFYTVETVIFSRDGTLQKTPAHNYSQFKFRTFAPLAFRVFRNIFGIERDKFLVSLCAEPMIELSNPGASGSIFYVTQDDEIICKTVSHKESKFLQEILPAYYLNLHQNIRTLLPKFFGFFCYSCNTKNVRIIVMKNLLPSGLEMHHKFDLKGSTYKRKASRKERNKSHPTFKDLDFMDIYPDGILLQPELYNSLFDTIERDCRALESLKIMDYSFLMGIHNLDQAGTRKPLMYQMAQKYFGETDPGGGGSDTSEDGEAGAGAGLDRVGSFQHKQRLIAHSTALESITAEVDMEMGDDEEQDIMDMCNTWGGIPAKNHKGENLLIFIGIIDILQSYGVAKKLEHTWKSIIHDGDTVSVHHPAFYAKRFKQFLSEKVFKKMPSNLKPALSFRRPAAPPKRLLSKESNAGETHETRVERMSQSVDNSVTVITIGADVPGQSVPDSANTSSILPSVLRDKPRTSTVSAPSPAPGPGQGHVTRTRAVSGHVAGSSGRPDVADVEGAACTPPPDLGVGGITSDDERIQIYVPSPQSTPYSTISRHVPESHKNITFVNYKADEIEMSPTSSHGGVSSVAVMQEPSSLVQVYQKAASEENQSPLFSQRSLQIEEQQPVSLSHVEIDLKDTENASNEG